MSLLSYLLIKNYEKSFQNGNLPQPIDDIELNNLLFNQIKNSQCIVDIFNNRKNDILPLFSDSNDFVLVYRYSEFMCESCIQEDLNLLNCFQNENKNINVRVAVYYTDNRENRIKYKYELEKFQFIRLDETLLPFPINDSMQVESRYFALICDERIIQIFFPIRGNENLTKMYFELIKEYYLKYNSRSDILDFNVE